MKDTSVLQKVSLPKFLNILQKTMYPQVEVYGMNVKSHFMEVTEKESMPETLIFLKTKNGEKLFVGHTEVSSWNYNTQMDTLSWYHKEKGKILSGHVSMPFEEEEKGYGYITMNNTTHSVEVNR